MREGNSGLRAGEYLSLASGRWDPQHVVWSVSLSNVYYLSNRVGFPLMPIYPTLGVREFFGAASWQMSQCNNFNAIVGLTENVARFKSNLTVSKSPCFGFSTMIPLRPRPQTHD